MKNGSLDPTTVVVNSNLIPPRGQTNKQGPNTGAAAMPMHSVSNSAPVARISEDDHPCPLSMATGMTPSQTIILDDKPTTTRTAEAMPTQQFGCGTSAGSVLPIVPSHQPSGRECQGGQWTKSFYSFDGGSCAASSSRLANAMSNKEEV